MRKLILLLSLFICSLSHAQKITVKGTVTDASTGDPVPGTTVLISNTLKGTQADFDGKYTLEANKGDALEFSSLGYLTQKVTIQNSNIINIVLVEDSQQLEEVVVIG